MRMKSDDIKSAHPLDVWLQSVGIELKGSGKQRTATQCPHQQHRSDHDCVVIYMDERRWYCQDCRVGGDVIDWMAARKGVDPKRFLADYHDGGELPQATSLLKPHLVCRYHYHDIEGTLIHAVERWSNKKFKQCRPDPDHPDRWIYGVDASLRQLYHLPEILAAIKSGRPIALTEGEKDADAMVDHGFAATTNPGGACNWQDNYTETLRGADVILFQDKDEPDKKGLRKGEEHVKKVAPLLFGVARSVKIVQCPDLNGHKVKDPWDFFHFGGQASDLDDLIERTSLFDGFFVPEQIRIILKEREFNPDDPIPVERPVFWLRENVLSTPGNLLSINALVKHGKSAVLEAMQAAIITIHDGADCFGFKSLNPKGLAVLSFDTEQSKADHILHVLRTLRRAGLDRPPPWFHSFFFTGLDLKLLQEATDEAIRRFSHAHHGVHSLFFDGVGDYVSDVNDAAECNAFIGKLHGQAIQLDCTSVGAIHFNPGSDGKARGHLGSQLERKAESNLRLDKIEEITEIWSDKNRKAPILKGQGPCFTWSDEAQMHVSTETRHAAADYEKMDALTPLVAQIFQHRPAMNYSDMIFILTAKDSFALSKPTAERRIREFLKFNLISKPICGLYSPRLRPFKPSPFDGNDP